MPRTRVPSFPVLALLVAGCSSDSDAIPYEFSGRCTAVDPRCVDDVWVCTTPEDCAEMMIACETGPVPDAGL